LSQIDTYETLNGIQMHGITAKFNTNGLQTEADIYDFGGASARGSLLRKEVKTYGGSIPSLVTEDEIFDGSGNVGGKTLNSYDGGTLTTSSGVPQHIAETGARGNLTSETQYANSSTSYALSATYEDTGSVLTSTTPTGTTALSYDSTFVYVQGVTLPIPSSGVSIASSESFDTSYTGSLLKSTDPNSQFTTITSYDSMLRPTGISYPDGGSTTWSYTPTIATTVRSQIPSPTFQAETQYDGYGRQSRSVTANGQSANPWYQRDTCYDANGNVSFVSYQYQGAGLSASKVCSNSSGTGDSYTYDVLGRVRYITRANGELITYFYNGRSTQSTDENSVVHISQIDGLGRTTIVCEISSNGTMPSSGSPASCGTDITGTGFTTTYSYALATGTTIVTQGVQTRTFQNDWLGRPILTQEPESGKTTYSYAYNSTGLVVTRIRPRANQTSATVTTTTTTQYDKLDRPISITYADGTPTKTFAYDASAVWSDLTQVNTKGRLSIASVAGTGVASGSVFSYDQVGRTNYLDECLPSGCGNVAYNRLQHYVYDLAGNLITSTDGGGTTGATSNYTVSPANELLTMISSLNNATNPPSLVSNIQNGPNGPISYELGNGLSSVFGYDTLGRLSGGWICSGSTSPSCTGGTQSYDFSSTWKGVRLTNSSDSILSQTSTYGYDEFNRLTSRSVTAGTAQNFTYLYDRWGNRWQQNVVAGSGPNPQFSFNPATNQINTSGYAYDAAGNMTNDGSHTYTYDAEGNITQVGTGGSTAQYVYNALNQRVKTIVASATTEFVFNASGQRVSVWNGSTKTQLQGQYYWGAKPVAFYVPGIAAHFQHQDWLGSERMRTTYNGAVEGTYTSLPFGDAQTTTSGTDLDPYHYASLDYDTETTTDHAQLRQYNSTQGRWMMPDPYSGSYNFSNPQSMNRYAYVLNNPLSAVDPSGKDCIYPADYTPGPGDNVSTSVSGFLIVEGDCDNIDDEGVYADGTASFDSATFDQSTGVWTVNFNVTQYTTDQTVTAAPSSSPDTLVPSTDPLTIATEGQTYTPNNSNNTLTGYCSTLSCHVQNYRPPQYTPIVPGPSPLCVLAVSLGVVGLPAFGLPETAAYILGGAGVGMNFVHGAGCVD
jgi:RHS repeat-associated protein